MEPFESTGLFTPLNQFAINHNSDLIDIQGNHQPFNQMGVGYQNIAFIDPTVKDYQNLVNGIVPNTEIVLLDPTRDGVQQITQILANRTAISSAHIISHGDEGSLQLGTAHLDLDNLNQYRTSLEEWKNALTPDADILLYGCNVAAGEKGNSFIQNLSQITDADIAASDNLTGSKALGGDWNLEAKTGTIEAPLAFQAETIAGYNSILLGFAPTTNYPAVISLRSVVTADLNGDSKLDLVAASTFNTLSVLLGTGTGTFGTTNYLTVDPETFTVAVADFNGDGKSDIASASRQTNKISIMLGDGTGNFGAITNFNTGNGPSSLAVGDFNADGKADFVTTNNSSNDVSILLGKGDGTFNAATSFGTGTTPFSVVVADLNQDGKSDLATANYGSNNISILLGKGDGSFNPATNLSLVTTPRVITVGDFNSDSKLDLATANLNTNNVAVLLGDGTGNFGIPSYFGVATQPLYIANGDLDGDGKLDLVTANNQSGNVSVVLGNGKGSFGTASNYSVGSSPQGVTVGDFNQDGLLDIAAANFSSSNVSVLLNSTTLVNFGAATYSGTEGSSDTIVNIPVTLSATPTVDVTVPIAINATSTATEGASNDYNLSTTSVVFAAGATGAALTQNIAVTIKPDNISETDETVVLDLGNITGAAAGTTKQTTLTIAANDGINYAVSAGVVSIPEGNSASNPLTFTVSRAGGIDAASTVDFAIAGTATNNSDYNNISGTSGATGTTGTINFAAGETQKTITMNVVGDTAFEPDETVIVSLSNPVAPGQTPTISNSSATTTINNDDTAPQPGTLQFTAANFSVPEGNSGGLVNATAVTVNRTGGSSGAVSVQARVNPSNAGTADASDYNSNVFPITVNFADGDTAAKTVIIPINGDTTVEPDETINLELISGTATGGATIGSQNTATLTIINDDNPPDNCLSTIVSVATDGTLGNKQSGDFGISSSISGDGRYVAFRSDASNLVAGDTNGTSDIFVHDRTTGITTRVSVASDGTQGFGNSSNPSISANGRYVAFGSDANNLVAGDTNGTSDIFVHDRTTGITTRASLDSNGIQANSQSRTPSISADGRYVAFRSGASNLVSGDTNGGDDIFVRDRIADTTTRVSVDSSGVQGNNFSGDPRGPSISGDGRYVAFSSQASNLVSGDTNGNSDIFVHDRTTGSTTRVSVATDGTPGNIASDSPSISTDGRYVAFWSNASNLVSGDTNGVSDIFVHDRTNGSTKRVSIATDGTQANNQSQFAFISGDGRYVVFDSVATNLVNGNNVTNFGQQIFVRDLIAGSTSLVSTSPRGIPANQNSQSPSISANGRYVGFQSNATNLVSGDTNNTADVFVLANNNSAPAIAISDAPLSYKPNDPATAIDSSATVSDADNNDFCKLTVQFATAQLTPAEIANERLAIRDRGTGAGQIGVNGNNLTYGGAIFGTFTGGIGTTPLVITFNSNDSLAAIQELMRNITYQNVSANPSNYSRTVTFSLTDADNGISNTAIKTINMMVPSASPTANADTATAYAGTAAKINVLANDTDPDGDYFSIQNVSNPSNGTISINDDVYVGGDFTFTGNPSVGALPANRIAKWDGSSWSALGTGMNNLVEALAFSQGTLYAGGRFTTAGGVSANRIAKWDGNNWSALGTGVDGDVNAIAKSGSNLYVGGNFSSAGGVNANRIANWDGSNWSALIAGVDSQVNTIASSGGNLYAGGFLRSPVEGGLNGIANWNGSNWSGVGTKEINAPETIEGLATSGNNIYAGGHFSYLGSSRLDTSGVAKWDGNNWSLLGAGMNNDVHAIATQGNNIYAGGNFTNAGGVSASGIAKWNGSNWSNLGAGLNNFGIVYAIATTGTNLYAGGSFSLAPTPGGSPSYSIAKWDGSNWSGLGRGTSSTVKDIAVDPGRSISYTPNPGFTGVDTFSYTVTDSNGNTSTATVTVVVNPANNPPLLTNPINNQGRQIFHSDYKLTLAANTFTDPDPNDTLTYSATLPNGSPLPNWVSFDPNTLTFSANADRPSSFSLQVKVTATDKAGASASDTFNLLGDSIRGVGIRGVAIDGYISGATLFFDANKNGVKDANEPSTITDTNGRFELNDTLGNFDTNKNGFLEPSEGNLVAIGGFDTATGLPLETPLTAPSNATVVTLLTSLIADLIDKGSTLDAAETLVQNSLKLPSFVDLLSLDPIAATKNNQPGGVEVLAAMTKVQDFITQTMKLIDGASTATNNAIVKSIVDTLTNQIKSGVTLDLSNPTQLETIVKQAAVSVQLVDPNLNLGIISNIAKNAALVMAEANQRIDKIVSNTSPELIPQEIARLQKVALGETAVDLKYAASGTKPISDVVAENTGAALDALLQATTVSPIPGVPVITRLSKLDSHLLFDADFYLQQNKDVADAVANKLFPDALAHFSQFGYAEGRNPSGIFAADYLNKNIDVAAAVSQGKFHSGFEHFIKYGMVEGRSPAPEFMPLDEFYLSANQDVAQAVSQGSFKSGIEHLMRFGMEEKRDPFTRFNIVSETFDPTFYLAWNQDVAEAVNRGIFHNGFEHFVNFGMFEGRNPSVLFDNTSYLNQNSDVAAAVSKGVFHSGIEHFIKYGMAENRGVTSTLS